MRSPTRTKRGAYLAHPVLGARLVACCEAALSIAGRSAHEIFGSPDDLKLCSSATLFASVSPPGSVFERVLDRYFAGRRDERTVELLAHRGAWRSYLRYLASIDATQRKGPGSSDH